MNASTKFTITNDRTETLIRTAVWAGKDLCDLYLEPLGRPNLVGGVYAGKVVRLAPKQNLAFLDCGLDEKVSVELGDHRPEQQHICEVVITGPARQGKAWKGRLRTNPIPRSEIGLIASPPPSWMRVLMRLNDGQVKKIVFSCKQDRDSCLAMLEASKSPHLSFVEDLSKETPHPDLDEIVQGLREKHIDLNSGAGIVIEQTEALVAIDVNKTEGHPLTVNLAACAEVARQIRLRNLSGTIMIDCLKMKDRTDANKLMIATKRHLAEDPAKPQLFGLTKLGLLEIARPRLGLSLEEVLSFNSDHVEVDHG